MDFKDEEKAIALCFTHTFLADEEARALGHW